MAKIKGKIGGIPPDRGNIVATIVNLADEHKRPIVEAIEKSRPLPKNEGGKN